MNEKEKYIDSVIDNYVFNNSIKLIFNKEMSNYKDIFNHIDIHQESKPFRFQISINKKTRIVDFPNFFTYYSVSTQIMNQLYKRITHRTTNYNRMEIDATNRKLKPNNYTQCLTQDKKDLKFNYDCLSFFDIANFYNSVYTHCYEHIAPNKSLKFIDTFITKLNARKTKGLLLGNYLSVICANEIMEYFCQKISSTLNEASIRHNITFFSDQFYIKHEKGADDAIYKIVESVLREDYLEFKLSESKYSVIQHNDLIENTIFTNSLAKLAQIFSFERSKKDNKFTIDCENARTKLVHFLNAILYQLQHYDYLQNIQDTYLKVAFKRIFSSPINLYALYKACENKTEIDEIKTTFLFIISQHPILIYDLFQLSIFEAINFSTILNQIDLEILYKKLHSHSIQEYDFLYWFVKIVILKDTVQHEYENIASIENKVLVVFLLTNCPEIVINKFKSELDDILNDANNMFNNNWLLFYQYALYLKKHHQLNNIYTPEKFDAKRKTIIDAANKLLDKDISFIKFTNELHQINEQSKAERKKYNEIQKIIPDTLLEAVI